MEGLPTYTTRVKDKRWPQPWELMKTRYYVRKLPVVVDTRYVFIGDAVVLKDPNETNKYIVRRLAALEGSEMVSSDEKDEPFVLEKDQCWVVAENQEMKSKRSVMAERIMDEIVISILEMNDPISHLHHLQDLKPTNSAKLNNILSELGIQKLSALSIGQSALQAIQLQQKNEVHIDDRSKVPSVPSNEAKPLLPSLSTTSADVSIIPKNPGISTSSSTSAGFVLDK